MARNATGSFSAAPGKLCISSVTRIAKDKSHTYLASSTAVSHECFTQGLDATRLLKIAKNATGSSSVAPRKLCISGVTRFAKDKSRTYLANSEETADVHSGTGCDILI